MPRPMASCEVWDVIKVPFPYTNRPVQQHRPALVVARRLEAGSPALLWVLMITSASHRRWSGDIEISDTALAGLPTASIVRSAKIATIEALEAERIGCLPVADRPAVGGQIAGLLAAVLETGG
jgi:mRNA interferase MazF